MRSRLEEVEGVDWTCRHHEECKGGSVCRFAESGELSVHRRLCEHSCCQDAERGKDEGGNGSEEEATAYFKCSRFEECCCMY